jgi:hypothetical protein
MPDPGLSHVTPNGALKHRAGPILDVRTNQTIERFRFGSKFARSTNQPTENPNPQMQHAKLQPH